MNLVIPETIRVLLPNGTVKKLPLEEYVAGVVAATMPAAAPLAALMAQAVAARTFGASTRRHLERGAEVCAQRHCQSWQGIPTVAARQAAEETTGLVAVHGGNLIDAYYFEHCDGNTRDAVGVLIHPPAYLKSVACSCGFATLKGHGIGMCQGGALVMARFGEPFDAILKHYYTGIELERAALGDAALQTRETTRPAPVEPPQPMESPHPPRRFQLAQPRRPARTEPLAPRKPTEETTPTGETAVPPVVPDRAAGDSAREMPAAVEGKPQAVEPVPLSLDDMPEAAWYPVGDELDALPTRVEDEILDDALALEITPVEQPPAPRERQEDARRGAPPTVEVTSAEPPPPPDSLPEEMPLVMPPAPPEEYPPSPVFEPFEAMAVPTGPSVLVDSLPGPRIIAGDLTRAGLIVTISDPEGNAVITVSGTAVHHGPGGFEAPLPEPGAYDVSFDHQRVRVELKDETVFITYSV